MRILKLFVPSGIPPKLFDSEERSVMRILKQQLPEIEQINIR